jgi:hypothetical protein
VFVISIRIYSFEPCGMLNLLSGSAEKSIKVQSIFFGILAK